MSSQPESAVPAASALPPLVLEARRKSAASRPGHLWVFSNEVDTERNAAHGLRAGRARRRAFERRPIPRLCLRQSADAHQRARARPRPGLPARQVAAGAPPEGGARAARAAVRRAVLPPRVRRGRLAAGPGRRPLRRRARRAARHGRHGGDEGRRSRRRCAKVVAPRALLWKNDSPMRELEGLERRVDTAFGDVPESVVVPEGGVDFQVPLAGGQKTGWYFDQGANRALFASHARGARVLDVFSYAGGFGLQAMRAGASSATCIDSSVDGACGGLGDGRRQRARRRAAGGRRLRGARSAGRRAAPLRRDRRRPARIHQAQEGPPEGARGLPPHQPARDAAPRPRRTPDVLLLLVSPRARGAGGRGPARRATPQTVSRS